MDTYIEIDEPDKPKGVSVMKLGVLISLVAVLMLLLAAVSAGAAEPYAATENIAPHVPEESILSYEPYTEYGATTNLGPHVPEEFILSYEPYTEYGATTNLGPHVPEALIE